MAIVLVQAFRIRYRYVQPFQFSVLSWQSELSHCPSTVTVESCTVLFDIHPSSTTPIYAQIKEQVKFCIASGKLAVDEKLPSVRELAVGLRVNPNTVAKAYRELELEGVIRSRKGQGSFVAPVQNEVSKKRRIELLTEVLDRAVVKAYHLDIDDQTIRELLDERLERLRERRDNAER